MLFRSVSQSRYDGTTTVDRVTTTAVTYTGEALSKVTIPLNSKVYIYFENAYIDETTGETNITFGVGEDPIDELTSKVQYLREANSTRGYTGKNIGVVFIANKATYFGANTEIETYFEAEAGYNEVGSIKLQEFPLENIDNMRVNLLRLTGKNTAIDITTESELPYQTLANRTTNGNSYNLYSQNGLMIKTYQSDLFNNWLQTDWIDGVNGISAVTAVDTCEGSFKIDALNLAQKVYNMLNRIAVSGGTYEDWQEAVYGENAIRRAESPIYCGGMLS